MIFEQNGAPHPMIPRKKIYIKDANNGNSKTLERKKFLCIYILNYLNKKKQIELD